ncbi:MAG: hypothetical protein Q4A46_01580 [Clostridia bacterium]|nr:hypothetical protein [Clostridia bacterium]
MRKHSKIITILLSAVLAATLVLTVFIQAFASEMGDDDFGFGNASTSDEAETVYPVSMEVIKAPKSVTVINGDISDSTFWGFVVLNIVYSNGEEYDIGCGGIDSEDGIVPPIAEINGFKGKIRVHQGLGMDDDIPLTINYDYARYDSISADFSVKPIEEESEEESIYPVSMEVIKAPESVTVLNRHISDSTFWSNVVLHIVYSNGEEYDVNCDGIDSGDGIVPPIAEIDGYKGGMIVYKDCISYNDDTVDFTVVYYYSVYDRISADFSVKRIDDPHAIVRLEVTKLPDKVFTAPLFTGSFEDIRNSFKSSEEFYKWMNSFDINNSIANHIDGMEVTCYYANGETITVAVNSSMMFGYGPYLATYNVNVDEYGNYLSLTVADEGDYKFSLSLDNHETIYTAKSASNPNPSINGEGINDTPANPIDNKSSAKIEFATSDVATNDNANNNNGTTNNGVVATGAVSIAVITLTVLVALTVAMYVWRKRNSGKA